MYESRYGRPSPGARETLSIQVLWLQVELIQLLWWLQVVCDFCRQHLAANQEAYADPRLEVVNDDAAARLEGTQERFDVIVADLADPVDGGPCYQVS